MTSSNDAHPETIKRVSCDKKSVRFNKMVRVFPVLHLQNYTDEEKQASFLSEDEMAEIKAKLRVNAKMMNKGDASSNDGIHHCVRGIEHFAPEEAASRRGRRQTAIYVVIDEQEYQWERNDIDEDQLAFVYRDLNATSVAIAKAMADQDESFVRQHVRGLPKRRNGFATRTATTSKGRLRRRKARSCGARLSSPVFLAQ
ncbi:MAG: hypothetical protein SGILL_008045 [Bacillariaceae sp.]